MNLPIQRKQVHDIHIFIISNMWFVVFFFLKSIQLASSEQIFTNPTKIQSAPLSLRAIPRREFVTIMRERSSQEFIHSDQIVIVRLQYVIPSKM
ncbi:hypothetical protein ANTRET_LOCUS10964 [Anthophora retusa]